MECIFELLTYCLYDKVKPDNSGCKQDLVLFEIEINREQFKLFVRIIFENSHEKVFEIIER